MCSRRDMARLPDNCFAGLERHIKHADVAIKMPKGATNVASFGKFDHLFKSTRMRQHPVLENYQLIRIRPRHKTCSSGPCWNLHANANTEGGRMRSEQTRLFTLRTKGILLRKPSRGLETSRWSCAAIGMCSIVPRGGPLLFHCSTGVN